MLQERVLSGKPGSPLPDALTFEVSKHLVHSEALCVSGACWRETALMFGFLLVFHQPAKRGDPAIDG